MSGRTTRHVIVFAKAPRLGQVKSRLAAGIGALAALRFHRETTQRVVGLLSRDGRWRTTLAITPHTPRHGRFWNPELPRLDQGSGDLGRRMARAFRAPERGPTIIVGSDIPDLTARHIWAAFRALGDADAVFGPARDGGYWLIGLKRSRPLPAGLFAGVRWSSPHALADTRATLPRSYRVELLEMLDDIDDRTGYERWRAAEALKKRRRVSSDAPAGGA